MRILKKATVSTLCTVALVVGSTLPAQASLLHPAVVSENPADTTPHIVFEQTSFDVRAFAQVGSTDLRRW